MEDLYRICHKCQGTGDEDTPDGPPCGECNGIGFLIAYRAAEPTASRALYPPVTNAPAQQAAQRPAPPPQQSYGQQSSYQQQAQGYAPGNNNPGPSPRQTDFMNDLISRLQLSGGQADEMTQTMFGVTIPNLTRQQASKFIEELQKRDQAARATAQAAGAPPF